MLSRSTDFSISNLELYLHELSNNQVLFIGFDVQQHYCKPKQKSFFLTYTVLCIQVPQKHLQFQVTIPSAMSDATFLPLNSIVLKAFNRGPLADCQSSAYFFELSYRIFVPKC